MFMRDMPCFVDEAFLSKLPAPESAEEEMLDFLVERKPESRLACQLKITPEIDNIKVTVAPEEGFYLSIYSCHRSVAGINLPPQFKPKLLRAVDLREKGQGIF